MQIRTWYVTVFCCLGTLIILVLLSFFASSGDVKAQSQQSTASLQVGLDLGDRAPAFEFVSTDGETIRSVDLKGKVVVMTSAAVWCSSCAAEAFQLSAVYAKHRNDPVTFITIDIDPSNSVEFIDQFRKDNVSPWSYSQALDAEELIEDYRLNRFEITYVLDQDDIIRYKDTWTTSMDDLANVIHQLL